MPKLSKSSIPRRVPKQQRSKEKYELILDSAAQLMAEKGQQNISTHQIAERAGIAVGSIYQFFKNIDAIKVALVERVMSQLHDATMHALTSADALDVREFSASMVDTTLDFYHQYPDIVQTIVINRHSEAFCKVNQAMNERVTQAICDYIEPLLADQTDLDRQTIERKVNILVNLTDMMTFMVWTCESESERQALVTEWKLMSRNYLRGL